MTAVDGTKTREPSQLLDYQELSTWLNDSVRHLRRLVHERRIPYVKVGRYVRFDPEEIRCWIESNGQPALSTASLGLRSTSRRTSRR